MEGLGASPLGVRGSTEPGPKSGADELTEGIASAMKARDFPAVVAMLRELTVVDVRRAAIVMDAINTGMMVAGNGSCS